MDLANGATYKVGEEVFEKLGGLFIVEGYCKRYLYRCFKRQRKKIFPTGVNMGSIGIAIPHTDKQHVIKGGVAIGVFERTSSFLSDGNNR